MQTEGKILIIKNVRIKSRSNEDLGVFIRVPENFFSKILKTQTKRHFLALVKHCIINLKFLNSPFCWTKFPTTAGTSCNSMHLTFVYVSAILNFVYAIRWDRPTLAAHFLHPVFINKVLIMFKPPRVLVDILISLSKNQCLWSNRC